MNMFFVIEMMYEMLVGMYCFIVKNNFEIY